MTEKTPEKRSTCRFLFAPGVPLDSVWDSLTLSVLAAEGLHGRARVRLDAKFQFDRENRVCEIDVGNAVGGDIARVFTGFLIREFGEEAFRVEQSNFTMERGDAVGGEQD